MPETIGVRMTSEERARIESEAKEHEKGHAAHVTGGMPSLASRYRCDINRDWRTAVVSLFSTENLGARAVYSFLKEAGYAVDLVFLKEHALNRFDIPTPEERRLFLDLLKSREVRLVFLGVRSPYMRFAADLTRQIHDEVGIPVAWGGTAPTVTPESCIESGADYAVQGEGEEASAELITLLAKDEAPSGIRNLWYVGPNGPMGNAPRPLIADLDSLPIPDLENDNKFYIEFGKLMPGEPLLKNVRHETVTSRGCPYICAYCSNSVFHDLYRGLGPFVRTHSVGYVMRELEYARERMNGLRSVWFVDEVFGGSLAWLRDFKEQYARRIRLPFECITDPRSTTEERLRLLKEAGLCELNVGIQTGSERVRSTLYDRHVSNEKMLEAFQLFKKYGVFARYDIIADSPFETRDDKRATVDFLLQLPRPFIINLYSMNFFPRTRLTERALREGIITPLDVSGNTDRCLMQFNVSFSFPRPTEDYTWASIYTMASKWFIPRSFLRWASRSEWALSNPRPFMALARLSSVTRLFFDGFRLLLQGRINWDQVRRFRKSIGSLAR